MCSISKVISPHNLFMFLCHLLIFWVRLADGILILLIFPKNQHFNLFISFTLFMLPISLISISIFRAFSPFLTYLSALEIKFILFSILKFYLCKYYLCSAMLVSHLLIYSAIHSLLWHGSRPGFGIFWNIYSPFLLYM